MRSTGQNTSCNNPPLGTDFEAPPAILGNTQYSKLSSARDTIPSDPVVGRVCGLWDGRWARTTQTENTVRHTKYGRIRGMVVGEGGRSTGVLLYMDLALHKINIIIIIITGTDLSGRPRLR